MRRRPWGSFILAGLALVLLFMPVWQLFDWLEAKREKEQATVLLYQVTLFQMELMGSVIQETAETTTTAGLNEWKRAAFAAMYAHERLSVAAGSGLPSRLEALDTLLQWILRVEIGGERPLSDDESQLLGKVSEGYKLMLASYTGLIQSDGSVNGGNSGKLKKADAELAEMVRKNLQ